MNKYCNYPLEIYVCHKYAQHWFLDENQFVGIFLLGMMLLLVENTSPPIWVNHSPWMMMSENWFLMSAGCWCWMNDNLMKNWFLATGWLLWKLDVEFRKHRMTDDLGYVIDECGRFSISSWLDDVALSPKTKSHLKSPTFCRFSI